MAHSSNTQKASMPMIGSMSSIEVFKGLFASSKILEDIKSYSNLLAKCGKLEILPLEQGAVLEITSEGQKSESNRAFNANLNKLNLCVRNHETPASIVTASFEDNVTGDHEVVILNHENVVFASNPPEDEAWPLKIVVEADVSLATELTAEADPVEFLIQRIVKIHEDSNAHSESKPKKGGMPFAEHLAILLSLLRQCNDSTTTAELEQRQQRLRSYVTTASCHNMSRRANLGRNGKRKYFDVMSLAVEDLPASVWDDESTIADQDVLKMVPNPSQINHMRRYATYIERPDVLGNNAENEPIYILRGRRLLHAMLSCYLKDTVQIIERLTNQMSTRKPDKLLNNMATIQGWTSFRDRTSLITAPRTRWWGCHPSLRRMLPSQCSSAWRQPQRIS
ncbi:unnamed protein product [Cercospora beticola]|nr:unnamed protein product [Cercospora beticola]